MVEPIAVAGLRLERDGRVPPARAQNVARPVHEDAAEPLLEPIRPLQPTELAPRAHEGLLRDVACLLGSDHGRGQAVQRREVGMDERLVRTQVALDGLGEQRNVLIAGSGVAVGSASFPRLAQCHHLPEPAARITRAVLVGVHADLTPPPVESFTAGA